MLETYVRVWYDVFMQKQNLKKRKLQSEYAIRKADIILIVGCLVMALLIGVFFVLHHSEGSMARISCDGVEVAAITFKVSESGQRERFYLIRYAGGAVTTEVFDEYPQLPEEGSFNVLSVTDGEVSMAAADCRDQICVRHGPVSAVGESIICLPHRFVVEITDGAEGSIDIAEPSYSIQDEDPDETLDGMVK